MHLKNILSRLIPILILTLFFTRPLKVSAQKIRVAVAANAQFVSQALKKSFEKNHAAKIELIVSSSGKLTAQIIHGAPYDIFLSADMKYPQKLFKAGVTLREPVIYASGKLVLWSLQSQLLAGGLNGLKSSSIKTIAVANPSTAPYGVATIQALKNAHIYADIKDKIVFGESISQVNQYLLSGAADVAFTAKSVVKAPRVKGKGKWMEIPERSYSPIRQGSVMLKHAATGDLNAAKSFYQFIFSPQGQSIFRSYGYLTL